MTTKENISELVLNEITTLLYSIIINQEFINQNINYLCSENTTIHSLKNYLRRILRYCNPESSTLLISLIYIKRFCKIGRINLSIQNVHKIFLISIVLAIKYNEDKHYKNDFYAKVGGIDLLDLNNLESDFLKTLNFKISIHSKEFQYYSKSFKLFIISKQN